MMHDSIAVFAPNTSRDFGEKVCAHLGMSLSAHEEREFEDGEHKAQPLVNVRGKDVFVIQSLYGDGQQSVNDKLCRFLFSWARCATLQPIALRRSFPISAMRARTEKANRAIRSQHATWQLCSRRSAWIAPLL